MAYPLDISVAVLGNLIPASSTYAANTASTQTIAPSPSIGAQVSFHQQISKYVGYRATLSYSGPNFMYTYSSATNHFAGNIDSHAYEAAGTWVIQGPQHRRLTTSAEAGTALIAFVPPINQTGVSYVFRGSAILGAEAEYALNQHLSLRAGYRAQVYKTPDFRSTVATIPVASRTTLSSEPIAGIAFRFGHPTD
jgi:hypothetical protein